ncbi:putative transporter [Peptoclostridium acidaminophilum DSM 3953]|uniref:Putative transporter n=1 Tax=Peptoclostridium acidaminophilum DSM 3953 TaxID=1286171 RepID=W8U731_PEPAC|nr:MATE family efflux transporter [Peptoclostridium acidaminophilum]AHM56696.1 putative transporter [Peptoclostridium acidaminophilum DSM 3953]
MEEIRLTEGKIENLIKRLSVPASTGFFFNTMFNVVDTLFAAMVSTEAVAGMAFSFPVFFIIIAFSSGLGIGTTAIISNEIGKGAQGESRKYSIDAVTLGVLLGAVLIIAGSVTTNIFLQSMGAQGEPLAEASKYMEVILQGVVFFALNAVLNAILSANGDTKPYRNVLILGFFMNVLLDPLFVLGWGVVPAMGIQGIALSTVLIQLVGGIYLAKKIIEKKIIPDLKSSELIPSPSHYIEILKQAIPSSLNMVTVALGMFVINYFIMKYSDSKTIAAYGIAIRIEQIALLPAIGLNIAVLSIVGQNYGAKKYERISHAVLKAAKYGVIIMTCAMAIVFPFARQLMSLFTRDASVIEAGAAYLRIEVFTFNTYVLLNIATSALQGLKKPGFAVYIGLYRQLVMPVIVFYVFASTLNMGISGIWWGIFAVNWSAVAITCFYTVGIFKKIGIRS